MAGIASRDDAIDRLTRLTSSDEGVTDDIFLKAFKDAADRGYGKAIQPLEHSGPDGGPIPLESPAEARNRVARELTRLADKAGTGDDSSEAP
jgi:hypothetical protein